MFSVATFNVKDLLVPADRESGWWKAKLAEIASRIRRSDADVVALQEIGGQPALDALLEVLGAPWRGIAAPSDERGIACAVIARAELRTTVHPRVTLDYPRFSQIDPPPFGERLSLRRPFVEAEVSTAFGQLSVLCIHLKSNLPMFERTADGSFLPAEGGRARAEAHVRSLTLRTAEALYVRGLVDVTLTRCPHVMVAGDFNDGPTSLPVSLIRGDAEHTLTSATRLIPQHKLYTAIFRDKPQMLDHLLLSPALDAHLQSADVDLEGLRDHGPLDPTASPSIDSDHALVIARFA